MDLRIRVLGQKGMWRVSGPGLSWVLPGAAAGAITVQQWIPSMDSSGHFEAEGAIKSGI